MNQKYRKASEIIEKYFENISVDKMKNAINIKNTWQQILCSIKSRKNAEIGELLAAHTKIIDLKNGLLLVETDHSVYIQTLQMYNSYILKGLKMKVPELEINTISYRLKGSNINLKNVEKFEENKKEVQKHSESEINEKMTIKNDLPEELKEKFKQLKDEIKKRYIDQT
ncbi:MAG: DUF721 domain-containing protein [Spirochaetaceae bacterium]|nr:DUF721 domain-containing protein [Spirochaetaceae bacterium]